MSNLLRTEIFKLKKNRTFWTLIGLLSVAAISWPVIEYVDQDQNFNNGIDFFMNAFLINSDITMLLPCILAGFFISSEYSNGTMKSITATGNSRVKIFWSKLVVFSIGSIIISLVFPLVSTWVGSLLFGFGELTQELGFSYFVQTIGLLILFATAFSSIMALFAILFTDSGKTIGFLIVLFLLIDSILNILASVELLELVINFSVFKLFGEITLIDITAKHFVVPIVTYIIFGMLGSYVFWKKEIK